MIQKKFYWMIIWLCCVACSESKPDFTAEEFRLSNGAKLVVLPDHRWPIITQMVWYPVGSGDEKEHKTGLAHFVEHLMFHHEPHLAFGGISRFIEKLGGEDNAFTSYDYTAYFQRFHSDRFETVMQIETQRMTELQLSEESAFKERDVVIEELHTRLNTNALSSLQQKMRAALYGHQHPYGRDVIGRLDDIQTLTAKDALGFYHQHYKLANAIIVIAGNVSSEHAYLLANKYFGSIKTESYRPASDFPPVIQRHSKDALITHRSSQADQAVFVRNYVTTHRHILGPRQAASFEVLAEILIGGDRSLINRAFVVNQKNAAFVQGYLQLYRRGPGLFSIKIWLSPDQRQNLANLHKINAMLNKIIKDVVSPQSKHPITEAEVRHAKNRLLAESIYLKDNQTQLAHAVGHWLITGHDLTEAQYWSKQIKAITKQDVLSAAKLMLDPAREINGFLLPQRKRR